jgi:hypothetical protein
MLDDTIEELIQDPRFDEWFAPVEEEEVPEEAKESVVVSGVISRPR